MQTNQKSPVSIEQMASLEDSGESLGISKLMMMENAGSFIARYVVYDWSTKDRESIKEKTKVLIVAGVGNNGGDAFVTARHLAYYKDDIQVKVIVVGEFEKIKAVEAATNFEILKKINSIELVYIPSLNEIDFLEESLEECDLAIVALFGTGFKGKPKPLAMKVIELINSSRVPVLSVDVPSGMNAVSGEGENAVRSAVTLAMHAPKIGMLTGRARDMCGTIITGNIGLPF